MIQAQIPAKQISLSEYQIKYKSAINNLRN